MSYTKAFQKAGAWTGGVVRARSGAKQHLTNAVTSITLCGVSSFAMQAVYRSAILRNFTGLKFTELDALPPADLMMKYVTCKDCRAKLAAVALENDE